jgi:hypothetical protein
MPKDSKKSNGGVRPAMPKTSQDQLSGTCALNFFKAMSKKFLKQPALLI